MIRKTWLAAALLFVPAVLFLSSCGEQAPKMSTDPVTFTLFASDANPNWADMQDEVGKVITEKTGVTIKADWAYGDAEEKIALMAASGDLPDLIYAKGDTAPLIEAKQILDLTELISKYGPNITKVMGTQFKRLRYSMDDQSIYFVPNLDMINQNYQEAGGSFMIQLDVLRQQNYPKLRTLKQYEDAIATYYKANPKIDGQDTIPLSIVADDWRIMISVTNPAFIATGAPDDGEYYIDMNTGKAMLHYKRPVEREYFRWLNHMNDVGLLDKESFVQKFDQYQEKITQGRVVALIDRDWSIGGAISYLKSQKKFERAYAPFPVTLDESIKQADFQRAGFNGGWGGAITKACKDPVRAIQFLDYLASDEGQILNNWGIEGKHYQIKDGKRVITPEIQAEKLADLNAFTKKSGVSNYSFSVRYGDGNVDSTGSYYTTNFPDNNWDARSDLEKEILGKYGYRNWKEAFPKEDEFPVKPWGAAWTIPIPTDSEVAPFFDKEQNVVRKWIPEAVLAKPADFDKVYDEFLKALEGIDATRMEALYSEIIQQRIKFWNE